MRLDFDGMAPMEAYRWLTATVTPRPIAWVSTRSAEGVDNLAPFSFFQVVSHAPPTMIVSISARSDGGEKDTLRNLRARGEAVVQLVSFDQGEAMNASAAGLPYGESEFARFDIQTQASERVAPPRVAAAAVAFECRLASIVPLAADDGTVPSHVAFLTVLLAHIDDAVLTDARHVDPARLDLIGRLGGNAYVRTRDLFQIERPQTERPKPAPPREPSPE